MMVQPPRCPKCGGTSLEPCTEGFSVVKALFGAMDAYDLMGILGALVGGALAGDANANRVNVVCDDCGYRFLPFSVGRSKME